MEHLIPPVWFEGRHWALLLVITAMSMAVLIKGADWLVEGASELARRLGVSKIIIGATIVSLGTTSPECAVSVMAAWRGEAGLALGNAVGSIIADTGLIFGLGCLLAALPADRFVLSRQGWVQVGTAVILAACCYGAWILRGEAAVLGRTVGIVFLILLGAYLYVSVRWARLHPHGEPFVTPDDMEALTPVPGSVSKDPRERSVTGCVVWAVLGLALVVVSSHVLISAVIELATQWEVPKVVISSTLVALGTSLPELMVGLTAIRRGHPELLVGNVIGADILNVLFVVGASAAAAPLSIVDPESSVPAIFLLLHLPTMLLVLGLMRLFIFTAVREGTFRRAMGWPLVTIYGAYVVIQYVMGVV